MQYEQIIQIIIGSISGYLAVMLPYRFLWVKPNIKISFPQGSDTICSARDQVIEIALEIENIGISTWKKLFCFRKKRMVRDVSIQVFSNDTDFEIHGSCRQGEESRQIFQTPDGYDYVFVPDPFHRTPPIMTSLAHGEIEYCRLIVKTPHLDGRYQLTFSVNSKEGSLHCNPVFFYVMTVRGITSKDAYCIKRD